MRNTTNVPKTLKKRIFPPLSTFKNMPVDFRNLLLQYDEKMTEFSIAMDQSVPMMNPTLIAHNAAQLREELRVIVSYGQTLNSDWYQKNSNIVQKHHNFLDQIDTKYSSSQSVKYSQNQIVLFSKPAIRTDKPKNELTTYVQKIVEALKSLDSSILLFKKSRQQVAQENLTTLQKIEKNESLNSEEENLVKKMKNYYEITVLEPDNYARQRNNQYSEKLQEVEKIEAEEGLSKEENEVLQQMKAFYSKNDNEEEEEAESDDSFGL